MFESIEQLQKVWPYSVEILVYPFEHPSVDYTQHDCQDFDAEYQKVGRSIYAMEMVNFDEHDDSFSNHDAAAAPLFDFFKKVMNTKEFNLSTTQYFIFSPDWDDLEYHYGKSLLDVKDVVREILKELEPGDEL